MRAALIVLGGALALAGCHSAPRDLPTDENANVAVPSDIPPENTVVATPDVNMTANNTTTVAPPKVSEDVQVHDDADATGLTSSLPDEQPPMGQPANETRPAEK